MVKERVVAVWIEKACTPVIAEQDPPRPQVALTPLCQIRRIIDQNQSVKLRSNVDCCHIEEFGRCHVNNGIVPQSIQLTSTLLAF